MFYCEKCRQEKDWPKSFATSFGNCELCGDQVSCYNVPSSNLPLPPNRKLPGIPGGPNELPIIPPLPPGQPSLDPNPMVAKCGACGIELKRVMHYSCPRIDCPCFPKATC